jgi:Uma2 family endonuclease
MAAKTMKSVLRRTRQAEPSSLPALHNGDRLKQPEFHRRYEAYPEDVKFELIGGTVYMASPQREKHSDYDDELGFILSLYRRGTPGVKALHGATAILDEESEPQPDLGLRIVPEYGGRSCRNEKGYVEGPPEYLAEIAHSTVAIDMHLKKEDYERTGVQEYMVICVEEQEVHWFDFKARRRVLPDAQGIYRSRVFPGLWIDGAAVLACKSSRVVRALKQGLASPEHAAFVKRLQSAHSKRRSS